MKYEVANRLSQHLEEILKREDVEKMSLEDARAELERLHPETKREMADLFAIFSTAQQKEGEKLTTVRTLDGIRHALQNLLQTQPKDRRAESMAIHPEETMPARARKESDRVEGMVYPDEILPLSEQQTPKPPKKNPLQRLRDLFRRRE